MRRLSFLIVVIVVGIIVVLIGYQFFFRESKVNNSALFVNIDSQRKDDMERVEGDSYIFYYPRGFVQGELGENVVLSYESRAKVSGKMVELYLMIEPSSQRFARPTNQSCKDAAKKSFALVPDDRNLEVEALTNGIDGGTSVGCKIRFRVYIEDTDEYATVIEKTLWRPEGDGFSAYRARGLFLDRDANEAELISTAIDMFELK